MAKITKRIVDRLQPDQKDFFLWDEELKGFGIRVKPSGAKSYVIQYRNLQGRSRRLTVGMHGRLTPEEARSLARQMLAAVERGEDPQQARQEERQGLTIQGLAKRYLEEHAVPKKKLSSVRSDQELLRNIILPKLGNRKVGDVNRTDILRLHHDLRDKPIRANRAIALLSKMFSLAEAWGLRADERNPCRGVQRYKESRRERFLSEEEISRLSKVLDEREQSEPNTVLAIRLLLFTGCRLGEILTMKWSYVNFEKGLIRYPDSKTGAKTIPLTPHVLDLLLNAPQINDNPYVIWGRVTGKHLINLEKPWRRIRTLAGLEDVRIHDLRHSFASVAAMAGMSLPMIGALLGHNQAQTTQRYAHLAMDNLKHAAEEVAKQIDRAMKAPVRNKVVPLHK